MRLEVGSWDEKMHRSDTILLRRSNARPAAKSGSCPLSFLVLPDFRCKGTDDGYRRQTRISRARGTRNHSAIHAIKADSAQLSRYFVSDGSDHLGEPVYRIFSSTRAGTLSRIQSQQISDSRIGQAPRRKRLSCGPTRPGDDRTASRPVEPARPAASRRI